MSFNDRIINRVMGSNLVSDPPPKEGNPFPHFAGIELELENVVVTGPKMKRWKNVPDDSLRNGSEFVTKEPYAGDQLASAITEFYANKVAFRNSPRTSTHIHINVSDAKVSVLRAMFAISYILEDALFNILDAKRKYCGYCMRLQDMNPKRAVEFMTTDDQQRFHNSMGGPNANKYYGFNINSVRKHATAEFRYFPGGPDERQLVQWVMYCQQVKSAAMRLDLQGVLDLENPEAVEVFVRDSFPVWADALLAGEGAARMFELLQEVVAMFPEGDEADRRERLVFVSEPLIKFAANHYLRNQFKEDYLRRSLLPLKVVTVNEWYDRLETARQQRDPAEEALREARLEQQRARSGPKGKAHTFDQFCIQTWNGGDLFDRYDDYVAFVKRHKATLIQMYKDHVRVATGQYEGYVADAYTEADYEWIVDPNNVPRFPEPVAEVEERPYPFDRAPQVEELYARPWNAGFAQAGYRPAPPRPASAARTVEQLRRLEERYRELGLRHPEPRGAAAVIDMEAEADPFEQ